MEETQIESEAPRQPWRFELWFALGGLVAGLLVLPALIYIVGTVLLGAYSESNGFLSFYGSLLADLGAGQLRAWALVVGPYLVAVAIRGIWLLRADTQPEEGPPPPRRTQTSEQRVEPKVSWD